MKLGFSVDQVVHDYGDLCQAITDLAYERDAPFLIDEFRTLNRCLDNAIADAVTEFSYQRDFAVADRQAIEMHERLGHFAHELRNFLQTATLAFTARDQTQVLRSNSDTILPLDTSICLSNPASFYIYRDKYLGIVVRGRHQRIGFRMK